MRATEIILAVAVVAVIVYAIWKTIDWYYNEYLPKKNKDG